jgi:hypothetical protein
MSSNLIKRAKNIIISSDHKWQVRDMDDDFLNLIYVEESEKASCGTTCCLFFIFFPVALLYAIMGWKNGSKQQVTIREIDGMLEVDGDIKVAIWVYDMLCDSEIGEEVRETETMLEMKKTRLYWYIAIAVLIFLVIIIISAQWK